MAWLRHKNDTFLLVDICLDSDVTSEHRQRLKLLNVPILFEVRTNMALQPVLSQLRFGGSEIFLSSGFHVEDGCENSQLSNERSFYGLPSILSSSGSDHGVPHCGERWRGLSTTTHPSYVSLTEHRP